VPFRTSEDLGYDVPPLLLLLALIHRSAWNRNSANFAFWGFCEVRILGILRSWTSAKRSSRRFAHLRSRTRKRTGLRSAPLGYYQEHTRASGGRMLVDSVNLPPCIPVT
jgi:hypothetical protein